jgi:hypothetical protein
LDTGAWVISFIESFYGGCPVIRRELFSDMAKRRHPVPPTGTFEEIDQAIRMAMEQRRTPEQREELMKLREQQCREQQYEAEQAKIRDAWLELFPDFKLENVDAED